MPNDTWNEKPNETQPELRDEFPEVSHSELMETIKQVFKTGADKIPVEEVFGTNLEGVPTLP
jgi:hypothetical protein